MIESIKNWKAKGDQKSIALFFFFMLSIFVFGQDKQNPICEKGTHTLKRLDLANQPTASIKAIEKILPELYKAECWVTYVDCFNGLAFAYYYKREYGAARESALKAVDLSLKYLGKDLKYAAAIANLALFSYPAKSISLELESLELERRWSPNSASEAQATENLGWSYKNIGDYDVAIDYMKRAIDIIKNINGNNSHEEGRLYQQIASCYKAKNENGEALEMLKKSIAILDKLPDKKHFKQSQWYAYREIAEIYLTLEDTEMALVFIERAIEIQEKFKLIESYKGWLTLGEIYFYEKKYNQALDYFEKATLESKEEYVAYKYNSGLAEPLAAIAKVHMEQLDYTTALEYYSKALQFLSIDFNPDDVFENPTQHAFVNKLEVISILEDKAIGLTQFYAQTKSPFLLEAAHKTYLLAAELIHAIRQEYLGEGSKFALIGRVAPLYEKAIATAVALFELKGENAFIRDAFMFAESNKAVLLYESMKNKMAKSIAGIPDSVLEKEHYLHAEFMLYQTQLLEEQLKDKNTELVEELERKIFTSKSNCQKHLQLMEDRYPKYKLLKKQTEPIDLLSVQQHIPDSKTAIVEFVIGEEKSHAFFITKKNAYAFPIPSKGILNKDITAIRNIVTVPPSTSEKFKSDFLKFTASTSKLYDLLLADGLSVLPNDVKNLIIIPDDVLNYLSMELLLKDLPTESLTDYSYKRLPYLFRNYNISYNYSASLVKSKKDGEVEGGFTGIAPSFSQEKTASSRACFEDNLYGLVCNKKEIEEIKKILGGVIFTEGEATKGAFEKAALNSKILHLATHACINEEEEALNKIFFSNEQYITQSALNSIEINASLTVLSACNTGNGKLLKGEGVMSLARSFVMAGSKSVLTSLWSIDDCATSEIMTNYYKQLKNELPKDEAIGNAKSNYLEHADQSNSHPYYWAAFLQFGNTEPIVINSGSFVFYGFAFFALLAVLFLYYRMKR